MKYITTDHKEGEQLQDQRNVEESSCNSGDRIDQRVQSLMFMMMMNEHDSLVPLGVQPLHPKIFSLNQSYITYITHCV